MKVFGVSIKYTETYKSLIFKKTYLLKLRKGFKLRREFKPVKKRDKQTVHEWNLESTVQNLQRNMDQTIR